MRSYMRSTPAVSRKIRSLRLLFAYEDRTDDLRFSYRQRGGVGMDDGAISHRHGTVLHQGVACLALRLFMTCIMLVLTC